MTERKPVDVFRSMSFDRLSRLFDDTMTRKDNLEGINPRKLKEILFTAMHSKRHLLPDYGNDAAADFVSESIAVAVVLAALVSDEPETELMQ